MAQRTPAEIEHETRKRRVVYLALAIFGCVAVVNFLIYYGIGGSALIATLEADGTWGIVILGVLLVIFEYDRRPPPTAPPPSG
jgi:hypothetical protein